MIHIAEISGLITGREGEREREGEKETDRERERERGDDEN